MVWARNVSIAAIIVMAVGLFGFLTASDAALREVVGFLRVALSD
jgi:hypothetical protein